MDRFKNLRIQKMDSIDHPKNGKTKKRKNEKY